MLLYKIKQALQHTNHEELLKTMGYHNLKAGHKTLQKFINTDNIYLFLKKGSYAMKYNSKMFFQELLEALDLTSEGNDELRQYIRRLDALSAMRKRPYIFMDTHFKRACQPIFALACMEGRRNIRIDKELLVFKSEKEILEIIIGNIIKNHYISSDGKLQLWGEIFTYVYHDTDSRKFVFDTDGTLSQSQSEIMESRAVLKIGNKII